MSDTALSGDEATAEGGVKSHIEMTGIEIVDESERTAKPRNLFLPWFAANISVFGMSYGAWILGFGINFWQATIVAIVGTVLSFMICGVIALGGKRGSVPTMVMSRAAFGVQGAKVPGVVSWLTSIGWETSLAITAVLATGTILNRLGWVGDDHTKVSIVAAIVVATLIILGAMAGYHIIMKMQGCHQALSIFHPDPSVRYQLLMLSFVGSVRPSCTCSLPNGSPSRHHPRSFQNSDLTVYDLHPRVHTSLLAHEGENRRIL